jgi:hypothetical protein
MLNNRRNLILFSCLLFGISFLFGCDNQEQLPVRNLRITIDPSQQQELFSQFHNFAEKHGFAIEISDYGTGGESYAVWMRRDRIQIAALHNRYDREIVSVGFYDETRADPASAKTLEIIDNLLDDLRRYISEIPNTTMTEPRKTLTITIDQSQREELFYQMQKLADLHALEFTLSFSSDKSLFHGEIHGEGFHITSEPVVGSPREISTVFFIDYHKVPTSTSLETVDELSNELKSLLAEIPNVAIAEEE